MTSATHEAPSVAPLMASIAVSSCSATTLTTCTCGEQMFVWSCASEANYILHLSLCRGQNRSGSDLVQSALGLITHAREEALQRRVQYLEVVGGDKVVVPTHRH